jgi:hypothetical protein
MNEDNTVQKGLHQSNCLTVGQGDDSHVAGCGVNYTKGLSLAREGKSLALKVHGVSCSRGVMGSGGEHACGLVLSGFFEFTPRAVVEDGLGR